MPRTDQRSTLYRELKAKGWEPDKPYAKYRVEELEEIAGLYGQKIVDDEPPPPPDFFGMEPNPHTIEKAAAAPSPPSEPEEEYVQVDPDGKKWIQLEVRKPAYPKPRGRRVLTYVDPGVEKKEVKNGEYIETVEVPGNRTTRTSEIKITLPSFQVGIYRDPRFPFRVHTYNGREGFNLYDVELFYGGSELVPQECKRMYIENDLCYDIRSVVAAIRSEHRQLMLQKGRL